MTYAYGQPQPPLPVLSKQDEQHLDLLSIFFYVYAGLVGLSTMMVAGVAILGLALIPASASHGSSPPPEVALFGGAFLIIFGAVAILLAAKTVVMILAGRALGRRSGYVISMVAACLAVITIPLGTALGIFALIMLTKPGVRERLGSDPR
jgi:hypothetical protein